MLQQTQVRTVIPYWERWMRELPNLTTLAAAPEDRVLKLWEGLGYYSRARNLQRAARNLVEHHHGRFPRTVAGWLELPGIGRYTSGAIASIAFNEPAPILDGNVIRVLTRLHALAGDPKSAPLNGRLWTLAEALVMAAAALPRDRINTPRHSAGPCSALNQALMELGATVCTPKAPHCEACPMATTCRARRLGRVNSFPALPSRGAAIGQRKLVAVMEQSGRFLVRQRPTEAINAGFWEFPERELSGDESAAVAAAEWLQRSPAGLRRMTTVRHSITRYRIQLEVYRIRIATPRHPVAAGGRWVSRSELDALPLTAAHRRIARHLPNEGKGATDS